MKSQFTSLLLFIAVSLNAQKSGIQTSYIDASVKPQDDFYNYCNGNWMKTFKLPESDSRYGSFNEINDNNLKNIKNIYMLASANKTAQVGSNAQKLRDFYNVAMDSVKAQKLKFIPVMPQLIEIDKVKSLNEMLVLKAKYDMIGVRLFYSAGVEVDLKNSKIHRLYMNQAGYGLPDKDYYFNAKFEKIASRYVQYITNVFVLNGMPKEKAGVVAKQVFEFEKKLIENGKTTPEMRDIEKLYNPISKQDLAKLAPNLQFDAYFNAIKLKQPDTTIIVSAQYFKSLNDLITKTDLQTLKYYAKWMVLNEAATFLHAEMVNEKFDFYGKTLSGAKAQKARWQRVHGVINGSIGDIISEAYVNKYFPQSSKDKLNGLIDNLIAAYRERIDSRNWMDANTKKQAHRKLDLLIRKIGYPDKWKDYSSLKITTGTYWLNVCNANAYNIRENLNDLNKPVDRGKWQMTSVTVNAYYNPTTNEITFPAAILQPPFYDPEAEDAANYGTMGSIIGHELTHGFDDQGAQFDADGNMKNWWSEQDMKNFISKKQGIVDQFNSYVAIDSMRVNGEMTQGENIADLGGLTMAYYAYKKSLKGEKSKVIDGFTGEQRFFIAWCQGWKSMTRDEELKRLLTVDFHSPGYFRAWAPLTNMKEFYEAFDVKEGNKHYIAPEKRVEIW